MKMSKILCGLCAASLSLWALTAEPWEDPSVNAINRLPARTYSMPLANEADALTDALEPETSYKKSLNGDWKFAWAGGPALRVKDFWKVDFDDSDWFTIDVPSCVEMRGFGSPGYTNQRYPHADLSHPTNANFAAIRDRDTLRPDYNPVSSYRTTFTVPAEWAGRDVILRFDGVYSAYYVWVNGHRVGYAEDSCLPSEFDITPYLNSQPLNTLAVEVYRWCDGSYLEDQDMFRFSGIFRDVTLWAKPKDGIWDFTVKTELASDFQSATLTLDGLSGDWSATLYDAARKPVATLSADVATARLAPVALWSAETPNLYTLVIRKGDDIRMKRVGFKRQEIRGNAFYVNGRKIKLKGVNRHETDPANGRTVSLDSMVKDIELFKRFNINTVRTSHYPDHHLWYDLCDRYGIYVVTEANVEGHEPQYGDRGLGRFAEWEPSIVERNVRQVVCYRDNVSVTMWSVGNETGHGRGFSAALKAIKALDPGRLTHWERGNREADVDSQMYPSVDWVVKRGRLGDEPRDARTEMPSWTGGAGEEVAQTAGKPAFLCEYAHAMGNAVGNLQEYWDVIYAYDALMGGCIWDWADQAVWKSTETDRYLSYGGDFDEEPNDGPFCCNGLVGPFRKVSAKLVEVGHVYRNLVVTRNADGTFEIENRFGFLDAATFEGLWRLRQDGHVVAEGTFAVPSVAPLSRVRWSDPVVSARLKDLPGDGEVFLEIDFALKADTRWAKKGWRVARNQIAIGTGWNFAQAAKGSAVAQGSAVSSAGEGFAVTPSGVTIDEGKKAVTVTAGPTKAVFCRASSTLSELVMGGKTILKDVDGGGARGPRLTCERAYTDNDLWMRQGSNWGSDRRRGSVLSRGLSQLRYHARPFKVLRDGLEIVTDVTGSKSAGFTHRAVWRFDARGAIEVENEVTPHGTMPPALPRLGLSLVLDASLENVAYYGRGPYENYVDRCTGSFFGIWTNTVTGLFEDYVRPQDNGFRTGVRWLSLTDADGKGVRFSASEPLCVQALHFAREDLEFARHRRGEPRVRAALVPRPEVFLNLDVRQTGVGEASCGPEPLPQYRFDPNAPVSWRLSIVPLVRENRDGRREDFASYVDPFTGTAGTGHTHPSACVPFGMVQAGPDTGYNDWAYCSGYQYRDTSVLGYSQTHLSGTGCPDYGDVQILPFTGEVGALPMRRRIDKTSELAEPGFYAVVQPDDGVRIEIAAAKRAAIYRLTWAKAGEAHVLLNLPFGQNCPKTYGATSAVEGTTGVSGSHFRKGWIGDRLLAYAFAFERPWKSIRELPRKAPDEAPRYVATFDVAAGGTLLMKVALSMTGADGAKGNLVADIPGWDFDAVRTAARARWNGLFARTTCEGTDDQKRNWYTALYHLYGQPNDYADADGRFSAADGKVYASPDGTYMTTLSLWDTFRAAQPWYTFAVPEIVTPVVNSFLSHYKTYGRLPVLSYGGKNVDCMVGNHSVPVIADAWLKGFRGFDAALAFEAVTNTLTVAHPGKPKENWDLYDRYGYFPCDVIKGESVSRTLECAYDDACAARFAAALGKPEAAAFFAKRAQNWKNIFDPSIGFARGKTAKGTWRTPFDPYAFGHGADLDNDFTEGNAFQYSWHVMQDVPGLVAAMGGREKFTERLDALFSAPDKVVGKGCVLDITGLIGQYVHGNEPSHHVIYFYPQVGRPEKAAERIREVFDTQYHVGPEGLCGNDDCGQMSAWYVFSAMGFYPFDPCGGEYVLGAPQVPRATLRLADGKTFTMTAKGLSKENKYVKSVALNGRPVTDWKISHANIVKGGELVFEMTNEYE